MERCALIEDRGLDSPCRCGGSSGACGPVDEPESVEAQ